MGIVESEFATLYAMNTTAERAARNRFGEISAVSVKVKGIRGGRGRSAQDTVWYTALIDVEHLRGDQIPPVFILAPQDRDIYHVNIFPPAPCPLLGGQPYPHVCWGDYGPEWARLREHRHNRTLVALVARLSIVLQAQNFGSCARSAR